MRFNTIAIPRHLCESRGIKKIEISRLANLVAFVGRNGSGKSRILDLIDVHLFSATDVLAVVDGSIDKMPKELTFESKITKGVLDRLRVLKRIAELTNEFQQGKRTDELVRELNRLQAESVHITTNVQGAINSITQSYNKHFPSLRQKYLRRIKGDEVKQLQQAIDTQIKDKRFSFDDLVEGREIEALVDEFSILNQEGLSYFQKLPHQIVGSQIESQLSQGDFESSAANRRYLSLKRNFKDFLSKDLTWIRKATRGESTATNYSVQYVGAWNLDGRPLNYLELSDGEKKLFAYAILFFLLEQNPKLRIRDSIIIVDEPELNLHPNSEIDLLNGLRSVVGENGQVIIATHSLSILSHLNSEEIFMVKDGVISHPSQSTPGNTLVELMGLDARIEKLSQFISSIYHWTYANYVGQCFTDPEVIQSSRPGDQQVESLKQSIRQKSNKAFHMLLDFGAGKGRVFEQLKLDFSFMEKINYSALEPEKKFSGTWSIGNIQRLPTDKR